MQILSVLVDSYKRC